MESPLEKNYRLFLQRNRTISKASGNKNAAMIPLKDAYLGSLASFAA